MRRALLAVPLLALVPLVRGRADDQPPLDKDHRELAAPFLRLYCLRCHEKKSDDGGEVLLGPLVEKGAHAEHVALWKKVRDKVASGEMPPEEEKLRPRQEERDAVAAWIKRALAASDPAAPSDPGRVTVRRLNRAEWSYTVQDLLGVYRAPDELPADDVGYGFDRIGDVLSLPPLLLERHLSVAESIAAEALVDFKPMKLRLEAEQMERADTEGGTHGEFAVLYSNGRFEKKVDFPWSCDYTIRIRAYGMQAGPEKARMALVLDGRVVEDFEVAATEKAPKVYEAKLKIEAGARKVAAAFTNDYYDPNAADPGNRDRNLAVDWIEVEGPKEPPKLPWAQRTYVTKRPGPKATPAERRAIAKDVLGPLVSRAFRRPAKPDEVERLAKLVDLGMQEGETFEGGLRLAIQGLLVSPAFLYRLELESAPDTPGVELLDDHALATRLSYFLWSSLPDDELAKKAASKTLANELEAQTRRLLADAKSSRLVEQFAAQWLHLRKLDTLAFDPKTFPGFDDELRAAARAETLALFEAVLRENRSVQELLDADFTFVNERLAKHYGIEGVHGPELRRVAAPEERRGLLGHASVLMATSSPTRTSPVKRGKWVLDVLLDDPPPPPTPGSDSLKDADTQTTRTLRERLEQHRARKECAVCHTRMDALGFALEKFDAIGNVREKDGDSEIDDEGQLPDGAKVRGAPGLRAWLDKRPRQVARALAKKLLVFALGRGPIAGDEAALDRAVDSVAPDYKLQDLVVAVTKLEAFRKRRVDGGKTWR
jgi:mono/diheme cytochrome c family protein